MSFDPHPPKRTSAKKQKKITREHYDKLLAELTASQKAKDQLIFALVYFGTYFPMRPSEWWGGQIVGYHFIVSNAKVTNDRGHSDHRAFPLDEFEDWEIFGLDRLTSELSAFPTKASWNAELKRLGIRLHDVCDDLKMPRLSFATFRGVSIAIIKKHLGPQHAGYFSGHKNDRMSRSSYPRSSTAPLGMKPRIIANENNLALVKKTGRHPPNKNADTSPKPKLF